MEKIDARKLSRKDLLVIRTEVIRLYKKELPTKQIVEYTGLSFLAVNAAIDLYEAGGLKALKPAKRGRRTGTGRVMSVAQEEELRTILYSTKRPWQVGLNQPYGKLSLWNREAVQRLIRQQCGVTLSVRGVGKYLQRWGFPLMKQNQRPLKRCTKVVQNWLGEHYKGLDKLYRSGVAEIYWVSMKPINKCKNGVTGKNTKLSMVSAIDNHCKEHWLIAAGNFTQEKQIKYLNSLVCQSRGKIIVIRNNTDHYTGRDVVWWLRENAAKIEVVPPMLENEL